MSHGDCSARDRDGVFLERTLVMDLVGRIFETFRAPRPAIRDVIGRVDGYRDIGLIFALSYCLNSAIIVAATMLGGASAADPAGGGPWAFLLSNLFYSAVTFAVLTALIWRVGRAFGGTGSLTDIAAALAWHGLATAVLMPIVALPLVVELSDGVAALLGLAQLLLVIVVLWLLANFVAEAHGFDSAWRVGGVLFGGVFALAFVLSIILPGLISVR